MKDVIAYYQDIYVFSYLARENIAKTILQFTPPNSPKLKKGSYIALLPSYTLILSMLRSLEYELYMRSFIQCQIPNYLIVWSTGCLGVGMVESSLCFDYWPDNLPGKLDIV